MIVDTLRRVPLFNELSAEEIDSIRLCLAREIGAASC